MILDQILAALAPAIVAAYLAAFFWTGARAARKAGRSIWLFGEARGRDRLAAIGFRAAFALAILSPLMRLAFPGMADIDPIHPDGPMPMLALIGAMLAGAGALIALVAQLSMGASWRVGVQAGEVGPMVASGLFRLSRNPTFVGQFILHAGAALAAPGSAMAVSVGLFWLAASVQIRSEERILQQELGEPYRAYRHSVPRWIGRIRQRETQGEIALACGPGGGAESARISNQGRCADRVRD